MAQWKKIIMWVGISIILLFISFCSGYTICSRGNKNTADSTASANIREQLTATSESLKTAESSLESANNRVAELESVINGAINSTEQNNKLIADAQTTSNNIGDSVDGIESLLTEYFKLVEQLQTNNKELTNRLKSSVGEVAGQ